MRLLSELSKFLKAEEESVESSQSTQIYSLEIDALREAVSTWIQDLAENPDRYFCGDRKIEEDQYLENATDGFLNILHKYIEGDSQNH